MNNMAPLAACAMFAALFLGPESLRAQDTPVGNAAYTKTIDGSFEDVSFAVEQAITNEGLVIDLTSHVGDMLARTKEDVGGEKDIFTHADVFSFCSAKISREVMEVDPGNLQYCPYGIFVYETADQPGKIVVGHRVYPGEVMKPVNDMLTKLVETAAE